MLSISHTVKKIPPHSRTFFIKAVSEILGPSYELSLVFIGKKRSQKINNHYRGKNYPTDILSFELEKNSGEIFINYEIAKKKSKLFDKKPDEYLKFLFIHGLCHLKGMHHGSRMEHEEKFFYKKLCPEPSQSELTSEPRA